MPSWGELTKEIASAAQSGDKAAFDTVRRKYLSALAAHTGRNVILYATRWTQPDSPPTQATLLNEEDVEAFMEVVHGLKSKSVDLILHSPGGSAEATEAVVLYLRSKFDEIRIIVPQGAMSAATMLACSGDRIVLARHSFLGPIDPQMATGGTPAYAPAQAILDQFELAKTECSEDENVAPWWPILSQYGPALLIQCRNQLKLSRELVQRWLKAYPFKHHSRAGQEASTVASALADHRRHMSHGRHLGRDELRLIGGCGLVIEDLEKDQVFQDLVLSVFHATMITFSGTAAVKIVENNIGRAFIKLQMAVMGGPRIVQAPPAGQPPTPGPPPVPLPAVPGPVGPIDPKR